MKAPNLKADQYIGLNVHSCAQNVTNSGSYWHFFILKLSSKIPYVLYSDGALAHWTLVGEWRNIYETNKQEPNYTYITLTLTNSDVILSEVL